MQAAAEVDSTRRVKADLLQRSLDEDLIQAFVALNHNESIIGFATLEPLERGFLLQGWVHPDWRGQGAGTALLRGVEDDLRQRLVKRVGCMARVYNDIPGIEALFRSQGYEETRRFYNMSVGLKERQFEAASPDGVVLKPFALSDLEALVEADNTFFADHWGSQPRSVSDWKYQLLEARPHDPALWVIAWADGKVVGECLGHPSLQGGPNDGWIAIVGVHRDWRGRGLGRAVLVNGLQRLQQARFETASLHVDAENAPAVGLYHSVGFEVARTRVHFRKVITPLR